jgi:hypothetical protein
MEATDIAAHADTVAVRQPDVEYGDVRIESVDASDCLRCGGGFAYDLEASRLQQVPQTTADHVVVIEQEDGNGTFAHTVRLVLLHGPTVVGAVTTSQISASIVDHLAVGMDPASGHVTHSYLKPAILGTRGPGHEATEQLECFHRQIGCVFECASGDDTPSRARYLVDLIDFERDPFSFGVGHHRRRINTKDNRFIQEDEVHRNHHRFERRHDETPDGLRGYERQTHGTVRTELGWGPCCVDHRKLLSDLSN